MQIGRVFSPLWPTILRKIRHVDWAADEVQASRSLLTNARSGCDRGRKWLFLFFHFGSMWETYTFEQLTDIWNICTSRCVKDQGRCNDQIVCCSRPCVRSSRKVQKTNYAIWSTTLLCCLFSISLSMCVCMCVLCMCAHARVLVFSLEMS